MNHYYTYLASTPVIPARRKPGCVLQTRTIFHVNSLSLASEELHSLTSRFAPRSNQTRTEIPPHSLL
jgi:hypothetical protein